MYVLVRRRREIWASPLTHKRHIYELVTVAVVDMYGSVDRDYILYSRVCALAVELGHGWPWPYRRAQM